MYPPKVLIYEPYEQMRKMWARQLKEKVEIIWATSLDEAQTWFTDNPNPDVIVLTIAEKEVKKIIRWIGEIRTTFFGPLIVAGPSSPELQVLQSPFSIEVCEKINLSKMLG